MNRADLRTELLDLGHHYLEDEPGRPERFLDQAAEQVILDEVWPQRTVIDELTTGQQLATLGTISQVWVTDTGVMLTPTTWAEYRDVYGGLAPSLGEPLEYWIVQNAYVLTAPDLDASRTVSVEHCSKGPWEEDAGPRFLTANSDSSYLIGGGVFDEAVLLAARLRALEDTDETGLRDEVTARLETELVGLRFRELNTVADEPKRIKQTRPWV